MAFRVGRGAPSPGHGWFVEERAKEAGLRRCLALGLSQARPVMGGAGNQAINSLRCPSCPSWGMRLRLATGTREEPRDRVRMGPSNPEFSP